MAEKACDGGRTVKLNDGSGEFEECLECGTRVRWDLVDHPVLGFERCWRRKPEESAGIAPSAAPSQEP
jgi:hypothetical protein